MEGCKRSKLHGLGPSNAMRNPWLAPLLAVSILANLAWIPAAKADEEKSISATDISSVIKDLGLKADEDKDDEDKTFWTIEGDGYSVLLFQYGGKGDVATSLGVSAFFDKEASLETLDSWNRDERYTKAYSTDEQCALEADLDQSVAPSKAEVKKFLETFTKAIPEFKEHLSSSDE